MEQTANRSGCRVSLVLSTCAWSERGRIGLGQDGGSCKIFLEEAGLELGHRTL